MVGDEDLVDGEARQSASLVIANGLKKRCSELNAVFEPAAGLGLRRLLALKILAPVGRGSRDARSSNLDFIRGNPLHTASGKQRAILV